MEIFEKANYDSYALWIGDNINKKLNISTKNELSLKIYEELNEDIKKKVEDRERLTEVSQMFLDSATGNMVNLISLLTNELQIGEDLKPYSHLSDIDVIDTIITHDHSQVIETLWKGGKVHNIFEEKQLSSSNVNLFKILGDYKHTERIILTSQNMRKVKKIKLYDHFWTKLNETLNEKNLILLGVNLDSDTKDVLTLGFSKMNLSKTSRYFVTSSPLSLEDESWLISNEFKFIYDEDQEFVKKMFLYFNGIQITEEKQLVINNKQLVEENQQKQIEIVEKLFKEEDVEVIKKTVEEIKEFSEVKKKNEENYIVKNLKIPLYLEGNTLKGEIVETETRNINIRLTEFRENRYPSYKVDDFSEINHYKALDIKIPFECDPLPFMKLEKKIFAGKVDIKCNDQIVYGITIKSYMLGRRQIVDFKNHDFHLVLLLNNNIVTNYFYRISENTVNIKGKNIYIFFKNLFSGLELSFKNKKINGNFKIISENNVAKIDIIIDVIEKYLTIKKEIKIKDLNLKQLLKNTRSLDVLFSYYTDTPKITNGNITIRTNFLKDINNIKKMKLSYPIDINFLGIHKSFIESTEIDLGISNMTHVEDRLEIEAFNVLQKITYQELKIKN